MGTPVSYNNTEIAAEMTDDDRMTHRLIFHPAWPRQPGMLNVDSSAFLSSERHYAVVGTYLQIHCLSVSLHSFQQQHNQAKGLKTDSVKYHFLI